MILTSKKLYKFSSVLFCLISITIGNVKSENLTNKIEIVTHKLYESKNSSIYRLSELNNYLSPLGIEKAVHSLVEIKKNGIFLVDPGPHSRYSNELWLSIKKHIKRELPPVRWVFNSTGKPENVLGNAYFINSNPLFMSSTLTYEIMREKCIECRKDLFAAIPEKGLLETQILLPTYHLKNNHILHPQLQNWKAYTFDCAKNTGDTALWNQQAKILFAGRLVFSGIIPSLLHADTKEWEKALIKLSNLEPKHVIGSGVAGSMESFQAMDIEITRKYISSLLKLVTDDFKSGGNGANAYKRLHLPEFKNLKAYNERHGLNVQHVWRELELAEFGEKKKCKQSIKTNNLQKYKEKELFSTLADKDIKDNFKKISPDTYVYIGEINDFSKKNLGAIANFGFIVGKDCVAVIDTGGSSFVSVKLLKKIREVTENPICFVINTHAHPDHVGGNSVFESLNPKPEFISHSNFSRALTTRKVVFNKRLKELMGIKNVIKTIKISREVKNTLEIDLGERKIFLKAWKTSHTNNDLTVYDEKSKIFWTGDLLFIDHIPVLDGNLVNWLEITREITKSSNQGSKGKEIIFIIPGHGNPVNVNSKKIKMQEIYLSKLNNLTRNAIRNRVTISRAVEDISAKLINQDWLLAELFNKRNITAAYAELEWEE